MSFREVLKIEGLQVCTFTDPIKAYNKLQHNLEDYSLVISDFRMPRMNGNKLCIKLMSINSQLKVILMYAYQDVEYNKSKFTFITKPIPIAKLVKIVNENLAMKIHGHTISELNNIYKTITHHSLPLHVHISLLLNPYQFPR